MNMTLMHGRGSEVGDDTRALLAQRICNDSCFVPDRRARLRARPVAALLSGSFNEPVAETSEIAVEDWDLLFRAALTLLARVAMEKPKRPVPSRTGQPLQAPGAVLRECLAALDQLRREHPSAPPRPRPAGVPPAYWDAGAEA